MKKNSQRRIEHRYTGRKYVIYSAAYESWKEDALKVLSQYKYRLHINFPIILQCHFYVQTKRKVDLSNLYEGTQDCMVTAGVLADDNSSIVIGHDGSRVFYDKHNPRTEVTIYKAYDDGTTI